MRRASSQQMATRPPQVTKGNTGGNEMLSMTAITEAIVTIASDRGSTKVAIMIAKSIAVGGTLVRAPTRDPTPRTLVATATLAHRRGAGDTLHAVTTVAVG